MFTLEDQIEIYTDSHFNASHTAQHFFTSFGETEIAKKRTDMTKLQQQIEGVLKQNVRNKYTDFLVATEQINQVGHEMMELKHLIENTQKLIEDARASRSTSEFKNIKSNRVHLEHKKVEDYKHDKKPAPADATVPSWLLRAADDVAQFIVEQQYQKAVAVVIKTRSYVEGLKKLKSQNPDQYRSPLSSSTSSAPTGLEKALLALEFVNERAAHLASTIKKSLTLLPNSPLWGQEELFKRLKLLITLNEYKLAAEGFATLKEQSVQSALFNVEITSDPIRYCLELSHIFYGELFHAIILYYQLFDEMKENSDLITGLLLQWIQTQISVYVQMLIRCIFFSVNDQITVLLVHLKDSNNYTRILDHSSSNNSNNNNNNNSSSVVEEPATSPLSEASRKRRSLFRAESTMTVESMKLTSRPSDDDENPPSLATAKPSTSSKSLLRPNPANNNSSGSNNNNTNNNSPVVQLVSGIPLLIKCLQVIFQAAVDHQTQLFTTATSAASSSSSSSTISERKAKSVPIYPVLIYYLMPQVKNLLYNYTTDICKEISSQIRQDSWSFMKAPSLHVKILKESDKFSSLNINNMNSRLNHSLDPEDLQKSNNQGDEMMVSLSYIWIVAVLNVFSEDIFHLLTSVQRQGAYNLRNDFSEIEPVTATCLIRILLRYIVEIESLDVSSMSRLQQECFHATIQAIVYYLVPSIQKLMEEYFILERLSLLSNPPSIVFKTIIMRLSRIMNELESSISG